MDKSIVLLMVAFLLETTAFADDFTVLRDPTTPLAGSGYTTGTESKGEDDSKDSLKLQAIFTSNGIRYAMINGKSYRVGQEFHGFVIKSITRDRVELSTASGVESRKLWLFSNRVNK